ncbi:DUF397 domain-containing protein [Actinomadura rugatobispora]|uniref:DUF397 domain-containing protein n=1 Tax=Actinomadura rugatobispora TaxID=1994 RepID=A0ABW1A581_9ACTN
MELSAVTWRKSSQSTSTGGECVEVGDLHGAIAVRDSKDPDGPVLAVDRDVFGGFLARVKQR